MGRIPVPFFSVNPYKSFLHCYLTLTTTTLVQYLQLIGCIIFGGKAKGDSQIMQVVTQVVSTVYVVTYLPYCSPETHSHLTLYPLLERALALQARE